MAAAVLMATFSNPRRDGIRTSTLLPLVIELVIELLIDMPSPS
jgi:hypothetical protein